MRCMLAGCAVGSLCLPVFADVTYRDSDFPVTSWGFETVEIPLAGGGTGIPSQSTEGNPGTARRHALTTGPDAGDTVYGMSRYGTSFDNRYEPVAQGAILFVNWSTNFKWVSSSAGSGQVLGPACKQSRTIYGAFLSPTGQTGAWAARQHLGLLATDFVALDGSGGHPNFSGTGAPIRFGVVTGLSTASGVVNCTVDFDNYVCKVVTRCPADLDNGTGTGTSDGGVDINDLLYFLAQFEAGAPAVDLDDGTFMGISDGGVDINDLLYMLARFEGGC